MKTTRAKFEIKNYSRIKKGGGGGGGSCSHIILRRIYFINTQFNQSTLGVRVSDYRESEETGERMEPVEYFCVCSLCD